MAIDDWMYASYMRALPFITGKNDAKTRHPELTRLLLDQLGRPDEGVPAVVITGSKGKGSVAALTFFLLRAAGYRVGLFTSPHLLNVRERIRVDGRAISEHDFVRLSNVVQKAALDVPEKPEAARYLGPVGLALTLAYLYFREQGIDVAVIESGRGGRFDESSIIDHKVAVMTSIFPEHLGTLGPTLQDIVWHKTGIITPSVRDVIIGEQIEEVMTYLKTYQTSDQTFPRWTIFGEDVQADVLALDLAGTKARLSRSYHPSDTSSAHTFKAGVASSSRTLDVTIGLPGAFQAMHAALAWVAAEAVTQTSFPDEIIQQGLKHAYWPGRLEVIGRSPLMLVDGAVSETGANVALALLKQSNVKDCRAVVGLSGDKDIAGVLRALQGKCRRVALTFPQNPYLPRADYTPYVYNKHTKTPGITDRTSHPTEHAVFPNLETAFSWVRYELPPDGGILFLGTQSFVADVLRYVGRSTLDLL